jgi:hypothetical protein
MPKGSDDEVTVTATVEGVGYRDRRFWLVVAGSLEDFHHERFLANVPVEGEGTVSAALPAPAPGLWVWLVEDIDGDGPESTDPCFQYSLTPLRGEAGGTLHVTLSGAQEVFFDTQAPREWVRWHGDPGASWVVHGVLQLGLLAMLAMTLWSRSHPAARPLRWPAPPAARFPVVFILGLTLVLAAGLRLLVLTTPGCGVLDLTETPWLPFAVPGPGAPSLSGQLADPFYQVSRHQFVFGALLRSLGMLSPVGVCGVELALAFASLGVVVIVHSVTRLLDGSEAALVAAALAAGSPLAIHFAGGLSPHGIHLLLVCLSVLFFLRGLLLDHGPSRVLWAITSVLGIYVFPIHAAYLAGQLVLVLGLALRPRRAPGWIASSTTIIRWGVLVALTAIPSTLLPSIFLRRVSRADGLRVALFGFHELPISEQLAQTLELLAGLPPGLVVLSPVVLVLALLGLARLWRRSAVAAAALLCPAACFVAAYGVTMIGTLLTTDGVHWYTGHWSLGLLAMVLPAVGLGAVELVAIAARLRRRGVLATTGAVALVVVALAPLAWQLGTVAWSIEHHGIPDVQAAADVVADQRRTGDAIAVTSGQPHLDQVRWALVRSGAALDWILGEAERGNGLPIGPLLREEPPQRVWVFAPTEERFGRPKIDHARLDAWRSAWLGQRYELVERWAFPWLELRLLERIEPEPSPASGGAGG